MSKSNLVLINQSTVIDSAIRVLDIEARAIERLRSSIDEQFVAATNLLLGCKGRVVVIGMGKSGHIANKIAATLASTGTPAFFVHPGEASHGDLGMITDSDVVLALSNSGETDELIAILPVIKRLGIQMIALCGRSESTLARASDIFLDGGVDEEACPLGLAPTASTTAALVLGDALAVALLEARGFTAEDFARSHPAGQLGRRLLVRIRDVMHKDDRVPFVTGSHVKISEVIVEMTRKGLGMSAVVDDKQQVLGIFTDGDLRRALDEAVDIHDTAVGELMTRQFVSIESEELAWSAARLMEEHKVHCLLVIDDRELVGALNIHDLFRAGVV
ncbi:MAG: arabinose 5-phosphate isomerase [Lysobacteraceae bacterium]|nr:MAG: arabinose 5-phosphate isomerase [Xanthomonadaceae bacterium]